MLLIIHFSFLLGDLLVVLTVLDRFPFLHVVGLILLGGRLPVLDLLFIIPCLVLKAKAVHALEEVNEGSVDEADDRHNDVEHGEAPVLHDPARHNGSEGVRGAVGNVSNCVNGSVHARELFVDDETKGGEQRGVDEGNAEADDADGKHQEEIARAEGDEEAGDALESKSNESQGPLPLRMRLCCLDADHDPRHVGEEGGEPDHALLPLRGVHGLRHPLGDGRLEEGQGDVGHHEGSGAASDVRINKQPPHGSCLGLLFPLLGLLSLHRPHDQEEEEPVKETDEGQNDERNGLSSKLVEKASKGRGDQAAKRDKSQRNSQRLSSLVLLSVPKDYNFL